MPFERSVNYLGHAAIASEHRDIPAFVLGAMLPDLANMVHLRLPRMDDEELRTGVNFHERTDAVFHQLPTFVELNRGARAALRQRGVGRGPARAAAHLGTEFLLDAALLRDERFVASYERALDEGERAGATFWSPLPSEASAAFGRLLARLRAGGVAMHLPDRARFVSRFAYTLGGRPLLAPTEAELGDIADFCVAYYETVAERLPTLLGELREGLAGEFPPGAPRATEPH
jgi:hypothetical protein